MRLDVWFADPHNHARYSKTCFKRTQKDFQRHAGFPCTSETYIGSYIFHSSFIGHYRLCANTTHKIQKFCIQHASGNSKRKGSEKERGSADSSTSRKGKTVNNNNITMSTLLSRSRPRNLGGFRHYPCAWRFFPFPFMFLFFLLYFVQIHAKPDQKCSLVGKKVECKKRTREAASEREKIQPTKETIAFGQNWKQAGIYCSCIVMARDRVITTVITLWYINMNNILQCTCTHGKQ